MKGAPSSRIERNAMAKLENASEGTRGGNQKKRIMAKAIGGRFGPLSRKKRLRNCRRNCRKKKGVPSETNLRARMDCLQVRGEPTKVRPPTYVNC